MGNARPAIALIRSNWLSCSRNELAPASKPDVLPAFERLARILMPQRENFDIRTATVL